MWFVDISSDYINERFNLYDLQNCVPHFDICTKIISGKIQKSEILGRVDQIAPEIERELPIVYGLIHARYIMSPEGMNKFQEKYEQGIFGFCPRVLCQKERLLPYGKRSVTNKYPVCTYCPCCKKLYVPPIPFCSHDGAFWGPNAALLLIDKLDLAFHSYNFKKFHIQIYGFQMYDPRDKDSENDSDDDEEEDN